MRGSIGRVVASVLVVTGSMVFGGSSPAWALPEVTGVLHGAGCSKPLEVKVLSKTGQLLATRTLVNAKRSVALEPHAVAMDHKRFIFSSFDCVTKLHSLYSQTIAPRPMVRELLRLPAGWWLMDASWDPLLGTPVVLIRDPSFNYQINVLSGRQWVTLWSGTTTSMGGFYLNGIDSRSGREVILWGDNGTSWKTWRLSRSGSMSAELSGPGRLNDLEDWFGNVNGLAGSAGSWACDWDARGNINEAVTQRKCTVVPQGAAYGAVLTEASGEGVFWLHLSPAVGSNFMVKVSCSNFWLVGCGTPLVSNRRASPLGVTSSAMTLIYLSSMKQISRLGASTI